ncbi:MAG: hypothetical protein DLM70_03330 [Chloroflexi bacterium]|nr:MAG: hypothetical protein DLM70_03330 [Chloroflexota bacterium]
MKLLADVLKDARLNVQEMDAEDAAASREATPGLRFIDVRERHEWEEGHIPTARHLARGSLELEIEKVASRHDDVLLLYCASGIRSVLSAHTLKQMGYTNVRSLKGGFQSWKQKGLPSVVPKTLTPRELNRYSRHVVLPEVGEQGQLKLLDSRVVIVGAGGLG